MAITLLSHEVSDLCIGKPPLRCLSAVTATVADAIAALKSSDDPFLSLWSCNHDETNDDDDNKKCDCECLGKICMADVICYLSKFDNKVLSLYSAFNASVSVLLPKCRSIVVHVQSSCKLAKAIDLITGGAQNLIVPIQTKRGQHKVPTRNAVVSLTTTTTTHKNSRQFCWITQEDIIRFFLGSISVFSPLTSMSISELGVINSTRAFLAVDYYSSAASAITAISLAIANNISVLVVDGGCDVVEYPRIALIGEILPMTLACCDETAAAAVATLSAGELVTYIEGSGPLESHVRVVRNRLEEKGMVGLISLVDSLSGSSLSDEESPTGRTKSYGRSVSRAARMARKSVAIVCNRESSLMAVMIQAIAHRVSYVWVVDEDGCFIGMVTFVDILKLFRVFLDD
ncbi:hypothetical protein HID58_005196 [Brassica napus]|uniref:CBS domain-containing protein n=1 Tax=Brassica napus TaxID=3708 RepID=A0ABQ8EAT1_BRANA|nr:CBS domain-containing protein CBSX5 [Brassica napus]KAH0937735.1 hypothetical protein HID58_005196 [Brassica napus]